MLRLQREIAANDERQVQDGVRFTGGGSLGAVHVGMLRSLLAAGERPDFLIGASVGAINTAHFAGAPTPEGVAKLEKIWSEVRRTEVFPISLASALGFFGIPPISSIPLLCGG